MQEQNFYQLPNTRIPLLQLMAFVTFSSQPVNRQDLHIATLSNLRLQVTAFIADWKNIYFHILSIFVYMFITCICCLHNLTHVYLYLTKCTNVCCIWCKCTPFAVSEIPTPLRQKNRRNNINYKISTKKPPISGWRRQRIGLWFLFTEKFIKNIEAASGLQSLLEVSNFLRFRKSSETGQKIGF